MNELQSLRDDLRLLADRVAALEGDGSGDPAVEPAGPVPDTAALPISDTEVFWALNGVQSRRANHPSTEQGEVMLVGSVTLPTGAPVAWQQGAATGALFEEDWSERAASFAALGHPVRLELLRQILSGVHTTAELASTETLGTTGQLHHHLRQLVTAGWVRHSGRGSYEVPPARVVPLLACLVGAER